jgi:predicted RND superfamily exporter protein
MLFEYVSHFNCPIPTQGAYNQLSTHDDAVERVKKTIDEIGISITVTSMTSALAFGLGCLSSIPGIYWLCLYAAPTIIFIFIYQLTFFVALITLDQRRIEQNRLDCCVCFTARTTKHEAKIDETPTWEQRAMGWYAKQLLRPRVKVACLLAFVAFSVLCAWSASMMRQAFKFTEILPSDSFLSAFAYASDMYASDVRIQAFYYFRDVDQSQPAIQEQMNEYMNEIGKLNMMEDKPSFCWLRDFQSFTRYTGNGDGSFEEKLNDFLSIESYNKLYASNLVRDMNGTLLSSRCMTYVVNVNPDDAMDQVEALLEQNAVTASQPINAGKDDWPFFTYSTVYNMWQCYSVLVKELISTSVCGVIAVSVIAVAFLPHWSAVFFVSKSFQQRFLTVSRLIALDSHTFS